jgi:hypothetical protein
MSKTYGTKSMMMSALLSLGLMVVCYVVIRHRIGFVAMAALIVLFDLRIYMPRYQMVTISGDSISFFSVNPLKKRVIIPLKEVNRISLETVSDLLYKVVVAGTGNNTIDVNMYPTEFKELAETIAATGIKTEQLNHKA